MAWVHTSQERASSSVDMLNYIRVRMCYGQEKGYTLTVFCFVLVFNWSTVASRRLLSLRNLSRSWECGKKEAHRQSIRVPGGMKRAAYTCSSSWHRCCRLSVSRCRSFAAGFSSDISRTSSGFARLCFREVRLGASIGSSSSSDEMTMTGIL
jgi:hypothetical protein